MSLETTTTIRTKSKKSRSLLQDVFIRLITQKPLGLVGGIIVLIMLLTGIFANFLAPHSYSEYISGQFLKPPSINYPMGTDNVGRDIFSRVIYGARVSMIVGLSGAFIDVMIAAFIGILCGYIGGKLDLIVQRFVDAFMCFPALMLVITVMSIVGNGMTQITVVLGIVWGIGGSRIVRGAVISIKENVYIEAARSIGASLLKMITRHLLPNIMAPLIVLFTIAVGGIILAEASMSFLGYGIPPPTPSWGGMLSGNGRYYMQLAWWMAFWPGLALTTAVFGVNMLGDALRDLFDPRLRGGLGRFNLSKVNKIKNKIDNLNRNK